MPDVEFPIPSRARLQRLDGWSRDPGSGNRYWVVRRLYLLKGPVQLAEPVRKGELVTAATSLEGLTQKFTDTVEYEVTEVDMKEAVVEALEETESTDELVSTLSASMGSDLLGRIAGEVRAASNERLKQTFHETFRVQVSETRRRRRTATLEYSLDPAKFPSNATIVGAKAYKAYGYKLYLQAIDYLTVQYVGLPGLRLRRRKLPPVEGNTHRNIHRIQQPLALIRFWQQVGDSVLFVNQDDYTLEVEDPFEVKVEPLHDDVKHAIKAHLPLRPTLYDLAERVFKRGLLAGE